MHSTRILFDQPNRVVLTPPEAVSQLATAHELIIRNLYSLISPGTELACLSGTESWFPLPKTPGYAAVGEIIAVGSGITKFQPGDHVLTHGPHAGCFKIDMNDRYTGTCVRVPPTLSSQRAVFARMASIALAALRSSDIELGDCVLIAGLGLVGNFAAQFATLQGATVIATDPSSERRQAAVACGIQHCIDPTDPAWMGAARGLIAGKLFDCFVDATGLSAVITGGLDLLVPRGEAILLGTPRQSWTTNVTEIYQRIHLQNAVRFKGALEWLYPTFRDGFSKHSVERNTEIILDLILQGRLAVDPLHTHTIPPEKAPEAYAALAQRQAEYLGVLIDWT